MGKLSLGSCDTGNFTISNQLVAGSIIVMHIKVICVMLGLEGVWSYEVHTECLPRFDDSMLCQQFATFVLSVLGHLATVPLCYV